MLTATDLGRVYDTLLCIPGMNENIKIDLRISRKMVLLLTQVIQRGIAAKDEEQVEGLLTAVSLESIEELKELAADCLSKAGLTEFENKLITLTKNK